jgi:hypothetical protein
MKRLVAGAIPGVPAQVHPGCRSRHRVGDSERNLMKKLLAALVPLTFTIGLLAGAATPAYAVNNNHPLQTQGAPHAGANGDGVCQDGQTMHTEGYYDLDGDGVKETHVTNDYVCQGGQWVLTHSQMTKIGLGPATVHHSRR